MLAATSINSWASIIDQQSDSIHLKPPNPSGNYRDNRPPFHRSSQNVIEKESQIELITKQDIINPCSGAYMRKNGTTCGLKEIMLGRCYEYQYIKRGLYLSNTT